MPAAIRSFPDVKRGTEMWLIEDLNLIHRLEGLNPRDIEHEQDIDDLVAYIHENGIRDLPPVRVIIRKVHGEDIIYLTKGHRRVGAIRRAKEEGAPIAGIYAIVDKDMDEAELLVGAVSENQGLPLTPHEESRAYERLQRFGWDVAKIAQKTGKSTTHIYARLELLETELPLKEAHADGEVSTTDVVKIIKKSKKTGVSQEALLAHHKATKVDRRKTRHHPQTMENHIRSVMLPLVEQYGYDNVEMVLKSIPEFVEDIPDTIEVE